MTRSLLNQLTPVTPGEAGSPATARTADGAAALLLAAGRGARFDPSGQASKLLHLIDGLPVVCHAAAHLLKACPRVLAVIRPHSRTLRLWLEQAGCQVTECADAHSGMGHSLAWGMAEIERRFNPDRVVVALGDMPFVAPGTISALLASINGQVQAAAPEYMGRRGNPVAFGPLHFEALGRCLGDRGAAAVLKPEQFQLIPVSDPGVLRDIDTPGDLQPKAT